MKEPTTEIENETSAVTTMLPPPPPPTASPHQALVERLKDYGQEDVFALWDELSPEERDLLLRDIEVNRRIYTVADFASLSFIFVFFISLHSLIQRIS